MIDKNTRSLLKLKRFVSMKGSNIGKYSKGLYTLKVRVGFIFVLGQVINPVKCILRIIKLLVANYYQMLPSPSGDVGEFLSP